MKINFYTSYFYQIRNFNKNTIPLSTAKWDPLWFHNNMRNDGYVFTDKRGIINGLKFNLFIPKDFEKMDGVDSTGKSYKDFKPCSKNCGMTVDNCDFMREYRRQLSSLSFQDVKSEISNILEKEIVLNNAFKEAIEHEGHLNICFMVFESPSNLCSERIPIQEFFMKNGIEIREWNKNVI